MGCAMVEVPPKLKSELLDEWADIKEQDGKPVEAEWYRMQARRVRAITDADVLRSKVRGDLFPLQKDHITGLSGVSMFVCGRNVKVCGCGDMADYLCDAPIGDGKTCDLPICESCRI